jgi:hypothetical protein
MGAWLPMRWPITVRFMACLCAAILLAACGRPAQTPSAAVPQVAPLGQATATPRTPSDTPVTPDEYRVYDAVIDHLWPGDGQLIIEDQTDIRHLQSATQQIGNNIAALKSETIDKFQLENQQEYPLSEQLNVHTNYVLISRNQLSSILSKGKDLNTGWEEFYRIYPGTQGFISFSRVGFDAQMTQALVYVGNPRGALNGVGYYLFLTQNNGLWIVRNQIPAWIA